MRQTGEYCSCRFSAAQMVRGTVQLLGLLGRLCFVSAASQRLAVGGHCCNSRFLGARTVIENQLRHGTSVQPFAASQQYALRLDPWPQPPCSMTSGVQLRHGMSALTALQLSLGCPHPAA